jgi:hypothetical protein
MKQLNKIALILLVTGMFLMAGCQRNYYSGNGKSSSKNCGCPGQKGGGGW